jgi:putative glutamine amidotransferase
MSQPRSPNGDNTRLLIGLSPRIMRNLPREYGFRGKTLQYLEQSMAHWVMSAGALVVMVPTVERDGLSDSEICVEHYVQALDGLILQGGADIDPVAYGESPSPLLQPTDVLRDRFELRLLHAFMDAGKPVLGICRGMQLINVAHGGTLYQDLVDGGATGNAHVAPTYDEHMHALTLAAGSWFASLYPGVAPPMVNSIHHQGVKRIGDGLTAQAWSNDGVIECICGSGPNFVLGLQWHPEFHDARFPALLPGAPVLQAFLAAARKRKPA